MYRLTILAFATMLSLSNVSVNAQLDTPSTNVRTTNLFLFDQNVSASDQYLISEAIRFAQDYLIETFGSDVVQSTTISVKNDPNENIMYARDWHIHLNTAAMKGYPPLVQFQKVVHEYLHIWQEDVSDRLFATPSTIHPHGAQWILEGSVEYLSLQMLLTSGIVSSGEVEELIYQLANGVYANGPVDFPELEKLRVHEDMIKQPIACCVYWFSVLAIQSLVGDEGPAAIGRYFRALGESTDPWQSVFEDTFGISLADFYVQFEAERNTLLNTNNGLDITQLLRTPSFNENPAPFEIGSVPETVASGEQAILYGWTSNGSFCELTTSVESENERYQSYADSLGLVVWFWSVPESLVEASVELSMSCGDTSVSVVIGVK